VPILYYIDSERPLSARQLECDIVELRIPVIIYSKLVCERALKQLQSTRYRRLMRWSSLNLSLAIGILLDHLLTDLSRDLCEEVSICDTRSRYGVVTIFVSNSFFLIG